VADRKIKKGLPKQHPTNHATLSCARTGISSVTRVRSNVRGPKDLVGWHHQDVLLVGVDLHGQLERAGPAQPVRTVEDLDVSPREPIAGVQHRQANRVNPGRPALDPQLLDQRVSLYARVILRKTRKFRDQRDYAVNFTQQTMRFPFSRERMNVEAYKILYFLQTHFFPSRLKLVVRVNDKVHARPVIFRPREPGDQVARNDQHLAPAASTIHARSNLVHVPKGCAVPLGKQKHGRVCPPRRQRHIMGRDPRDRLARRDGGQLAVSSDKEDGRPGPPSVDEHQRARGVAAVNEPP